MVGLHWQWMECLLHILNTQFLVDEGEAEILTIQDGYDTAVKFFADVLPA